MKKFRAIDESHQRVYYEAIFEAEDEDEARVKAVEMFSFCSVDFDIEETNNDNT